MKIAPHHWVRGIPAAMLLVAGLFAALGLAAMLTMAFVVSGAAKKRLRL